MDSDLRVGVFVTPVDAQIPDVETTALERRAREVEQYYRDLETRLQAVEQAEAPEDRMYM